MATFELASCGNHSNPISLIIKNQFGALERGMVVYGPDAKLLGRIVFTNKNVLCVAPMSFPAPVLDHRFGLRGVLTAIH